MVQPPPPFPQPDEAPPKLVEIDQPQPDRRQPLPDVIPVPADPEKPTITEPTD